MIASAVHIVERLKPGTFVKYREGCDAIGAAHADMNEPTSGVDRDFGCRVAILGAAARRRDAVDNREAPIVDLGKYEHPDRHLTHDVDPPAWMKREVTRLAAPGKRHLVVSRQTNTRLVTPNPEEVETEIGGRDSSVGQELRGVRARAALVSFIWIGCRRRRKPIDNNASSVQLVEQYLPISPAGDNEVFALGVNRNVRGISSGRPRYAYGLEMAPAPSLILAKYAFRLAPDRVHNRKRGMPSEE
jgi:hypothetical protein